MLYAVLLFSPFGIVEPVKCAYQVSGYAPNAVKRYAAQMICQFHIFTIHTDVQPD